MATRREHRTAVVQTLGEIEHCCLVLREALANHTDLTPTVRQLAAAALELHYRAGALQGADEAYATMRERGDRPILGGP